MLHFGAAMPLAPMFLGVTFTDHSPSTMWVLMLVSFSPVVPMPKRVSRVSVGSIRVVSSRRVPSCASSATTSPPVAMACRLSPASASSEDDWLRITPMSVRFSAMESLAPVLPISILHLLHAMMIFAIVLVMFNVVVSNDLRNCIQVLLEPKSVFFPVGF